MTQADSLSLLTKLSNAAAVPGKEDEVREIFKAELEGTGAISIDRMGNFYLKRPQEAGPHIVVDCHMDEVGFMVQSITPKGYLRVLGLGGWNAATLPAQPVVVLGKNGKIPGVFGSLPPHFSTNKDSAATFEDLYIDIGADSKEEVISWGIRPGTSVCPEVNARLSNNPNRIIGKAFDNRVGCGVCIEAAKATQDTDKNVTYIGAVQEEGGLRGATVSSRISKPDLAIILEGTPADDAPGAALSNCQGALGKGVQIRCYDPTHLANAALVEWAIDQAEEASIPYQVAVRRSGGTNAGRYHLAGEGVPTLVLGVPARYIHSHQSMIDLGDYRATCQLTEQIIRNLDDTIYQSLLPK